MMRLFVILVGFAIPSLAVAMTPIVSDTESLQTLVVEHEAIDALAPSDLPVSADGYVRARRQEVVEMTALVEHALVSLSLAPSLSTLNQMAVDGQEVVSYNQWLASSIVSAPEASPMQVSGLSLRVNAAVRNEHTYVAITASDSRRPDLQNVIAIMDTSSLDTLTLNSVTTLDLTPIDGSGSGILLPDEEYWVVFGIEAPDHNEGLPAGLYHWSYTESAGPYDASPNWSVGSLTSTGNTAGQNWVSSMETPFSFGLTLAPIPEPDTALLLLVSLSLCLCHRHRIS